MRGKQLLAQYGCVSCHDIPGVEGPRCDWNDDRVYSEVLQRLNARQMRGDVPLNLTATSLVRREIARVRVFLGRTCLRYRLENWKLLRAPLRPYFLRSFMRPSRVR